jgi:putative FmdB family regulatory protein
MPTYDYRCKKCSHTWEQFQSIKADPIKKCPECKKNQAERVIGPGAAILFKGSGFYLTDYRSESYKKAAAADQPASSSPETKSSSSSTPSKSESKSTTKSGN